MTRKAQLTAEERRRERERRGEETKEGRAAKEKERLRSGNGAPITRLGSWVP